MSHQFNDQLDQIAEELSESYINGNISTVMNELGEMPIYKAMYMAILLYERFGSSSIRSSILRAIENRIEE